MRNTGVTQRSSAARSGFTMAESLLAMTIATVSATAMLTSLGIAITTSSNAAESLIAGGLAQQLMDEVSTFPFPTGNTTAASSGTPRSQFIDMDSFSNYIASPPVDRRGKVIGTEGDPNSATPTTRAAVMQPNSTYLAAFTQRVLVERVVPNGTDWTVVGTASNYRRVTVTITVSTSNRAMRTPAQLVRIFTYVPPAP